MKILKIHIKNLNSLKLETVIDFTESPFLETGLFAIVGDTGAGKTTILDAITLGLYGRVHRNKDVKEVLSYGATDCMAEVEFEVKNERYLAHWDIYRARNKVDGKIQPATRQIRKWDMEAQDFLVLTDRIREVDEKIEEITGLDYDRFCRSVLLSQGDFAAFLKSSDRNRSDLLERITGTEIYSQISKAAFARHRLEEGKLKEMKQNLENLQLMDKEDVKDLKAFLKEQRAESTVLKKDLGTLRKQLQWFEEVQNLEKRKVNLEQQQAVIALEKSEQQEDLKRLEAHLKTVPFQAQLAIFEDKQLAVNSLKLKQATTTAHLKTLESSEKKGTTLFEQKKEAFDILRKERPERLKLFAKVMKLDAEIEQKELPLKNKIAEVQDLTENIKAEQEGLIHLQLRLQQSTTTLAQEKAWAKANEAWLNLPKKYEPIEKLIFQTGMTNKEYVRIKKEGEALVKVLETAQKLEKQLAAELQKITDKIAQQEQIFQEKLPENYALGRTGLLDSLSSEIEELGDKKKNLAELKRLNAEYKELIAEYEEFRVELREYESEDFRLSNELLNVLDEEARLKKELTFKEHIYHQQLVIANYDKDRAELEDGEPCPVCFATEHPFREQNLTAYVNKTKEEFQQAKSLYEKVSEQLKSLVTQQTKLTTKILDLKGNEKQNIAGRMEKKMDKIQAIEEKFAGAISTYQSEDFAAVNAVFFDNKISQFDVEIVEKKQLREALQKINSALDELNKKEKYLREKLVNQQMIVQQKTQESDYNNNKINELEKSVENNTAELKTCLLPYQIDFKLENGNAIFKELGLKKTEVEANQTQLQVLNQEVSVFEKEVDLTAKTLKEKEGRLKKLAAEVEKEQTILDKIKSERTAQFGAKNVEVERAQFEQNLEEKEADLEAAKKHLAEVVLQLKTSRNQLKDIEKELQKGEKVSAEIYAQILEKLTAAGFANLDNLKAAILADDMADNIQKQRQILQQKEAENAQFLKVNAKDLAVALTKGDSDLDVEKVSLNLEEKEDAFQTLQQQIGSNQSLLAINDERKKEAKDLLQSIDNQRKETNRWAAINQLIGSADGKVFRTFAQGLTLKKLVAFANQHLQNLNGRYLILKPDDKDLQLDILDTYQADNVRSMNTLSGGESFLVSLALALGLSDLAGRNTNIRSLFIDEGFGTLDESTLDLAISTLENLQSSGKTIGVISHVKELKERITTQIRVRKKGSGFSELEVV